MHLQYAKRQDSVVANVPTANGVGGSRTADDPSPSGTKLVVGTNTGAGPSGTAGPNFALGRFVFLSPGPDITVLTVPLTLEVVSF